jgi:hypothetical protein
MHGQFASTHASAEYLDTQQPCGAWLDAWHGNGLQMPDFESKLAWSAWIGHLVLSIQDHVDPLKTEPTRFHTLP